MDAGRIEDDGAAHSTERRVLLAKPAAAAEVLGIGVRTLWTLTKRGEIACIRIGRSVRYSTDYLEEWVRSRAGTGDPCEGRSAPQLRRDASVRR